jgi:hypothetical protein
MPKEGENSIIFYAIKLSIKLNKTHGITNLYKNIFC